ncbi:hypothetical protein GCM10010342_76170 [Streptomyces anulatus]|nr:hypothetical protein GCM10010342_76170 [Streptomyces anulatus]
MVLSKLRHDEHVEIAELVLKFVQVLVWPAATVTLVLGLRAPISKAIGRLSRLETMAGTAEFAEEARDVRDEAEEITATQGINENNGEEGPVDNGPEPEPRPDPDSQPQPDPEPRSDPEPLPEPRSDPEPPPDLEPQPRPEPRSEQTVADRMLNQHCSTPEWRRAGTLRSAEAEWLALRAPMDAFSEPLEIAAVSPSGAVLTAWARLEKVCLGSRSLHGSTPRGGTSTLMRQRLRAAGAPSEIFDIYDRLRRLRNRAAHDPDTVTSEAAVDFISSCRTIARVIKEDPGLF